MKVFTIDEENNILAFRSAPAGAVAFRSAKELAAISADWSLARLVEIWNSFAGAAPFGDLAPVKKFTSRQTGIERIWRAIQRIAPEEEPETSAEPVAAPPAKAAKRAPKADASEKTPRAPREGSKQEIVINMLKRKGGATAPDIMEATGWQAHTVRGFIAGTLKKRGLVVKSFANENKVRTYQIE